MTLSLTQSEADAKIMQIDEAVANARTLANQMVDTADTMTNNSWLGGKAARFNGIMHQHHDDFRALVDALTEVGENGKVAIQELAGQDAG